MPLRKSEEYIRVATAHGAKLHQADDGLWCVLDQTNSLLWFAWFKTEGTAAWAYCFEHGLADFT